MPRAHFNFGGNVYCTKRPLIESEVAMKTSQAKLKAELLKEAETLFAQLMEWDEQTTEPNMTQIEEIVLQL